MIIKTEKRDVFLKILFIALLLADVVYTYWVNYNLMTLDGDMSSLIMPCEPYRHLFTDPFGLDAVFHHEHNPATNRFFIHWLMKTYFTFAPIVLQTFFDPVQSLFISVAGGRTLMQVVMIYLLAVYGSGSFSPWNKKFLICAVIVTPFFQIMGYNELMGLSFGAITYTFFYTLPLILIGIYFLPFYFRYILGENIRFNFLMHFNLLLLLLMICIGGSMGAPSMLIGCSIVLIHLLFRKFKAETGSFFRRVRKSFTGIERNVLMHFTAACIIALYSIYVGTYNTENDWTEMPLLERYKLLPKGLWFILTFKLASGLLIILTIAYVIYLKAKKKIAGDRRAQVLKYAGIFSILFILMLPLGGYRAYRPLIIRVDTFTPVTWVIFFSYLFAAVLMLENVRGWAKSILVVIYVGIAAIYTNADRVPGFNNYEQKEALRVISQSDQKEVVVKECYLLFWGPSNDPQNSYLNGKLIQFWNITPDHKLYYSK